jgi:hypothetical protein
MKPMRSPSLEFLALVMIAIVMMNDAGFDYRFGHFGLRVLNLMTFCSSRRIARIGLSADKSRTALCERRVAWRLIFYQSAALRRYSKLIS